MSKKLKDKNIYKTSDFKLFISKEIPQEQTIECFEKLKWEQVDLKMKKIKPKKEKLKETIIDLGCAFLIGLMVALTILIFGSC